MIKNGADSGWSYAKEVANGGEEQPRVKRYKVSANWHWGEVGSELCGFFGNVISDCFQDKFKRFASNSKPFLELFL